TWVISWMHELERNAKDKSLSAFIKLRKSMLGIQPNKRSDALEVRRELSYTAIKALFHAAETALTSVHKSSQNPSTTLWAESGKLIGWGEAINIVSSDSTTPRFKDAMTHGEKTERPLKKVLLNIVELYDSRICSSHEGATRTQEIPTTLNNTYIHRVAEINKLFIELKRRLATAYQTKIDCLWQQLLQNPVVRAGFSHELGPRGDVESTQGESPRIDKTPSNFNGERISANKKRNPLDTVPAMRHPEGSRMKVEYFHLIAYPPLPAIQRLNQTTRYLYKAFKRH
ncbi:MAG: hypothetical protein LQ347_006786, partial [Umbilicaria vellea]